MSLSRSARFPLLKLPWLCIEGVVRSWDIFDIIFFAAISKRTRQIVKHLKIPLNRIEVFLGRWKDKNIRLGNSKKEWVFKKESETRPSSDEHLVLQQNVIPFYTKRTNDAFESYTDGNEMTAIKMAMEFLNEVFKCSVETVNIHADNFTESGDIGVRSSRNLYITYHKTQSLGHAHNQKMSLLLKNLEVTDICSFFGTNTELDFYCDPKLFKCKELKFLGTATWVTPEILMQFEVPRLIFDECPFSVEYILSFVTNWFHSDNMKLEYLYILRQRQKISSEKFQTVELNPVPFSGRTRVPLLSLAKCSKTSCQLLRGVPNQLKSVIIKEESVVIDDHFPFSLRDFSFIIACRYSTIEDLRVTIQTFSATLVLENMIRSLKLIKLKSLEMRFHEIFFHLYKQLIEICDPLILKIIKIPRQCTTQIYRSIVNTDQWKKCERIYLNSHIIAQHTSSLEVNYDGFLHLKHIYIGVNAINKDDALKLIKMYLSFTYMQGGFEVSTRVRIEKQAVFNRILAEYPMARRSLDFIRGLWVPEIRQCLLEVNPTYFSIRGKFIDNIAVAFEMFAAVRRENARQAELAPP